MAKAGRAYIVLPVEWLILWDTQALGSKAYSRLMVKVYDATSYFYGEGIILFQ
jgi:hypothetical protein